MILYHGSTVEVQQPRILKSEIGRDFGFAFYTTDIRTQAERWARRHDREPPHKNRSSACRQRL